MTETPTENAGPPSQAPRKRGRGFYALIIFFALLGTITATALCTTWWIRRQVHAKPIQPVELTEAEHNALEAKLESFSGAEAQSQEVDEDGDPIRRSLTITEREINGLLHHNSDLGEVLHIYLHPHMVSAKANIPIEEDAPVFGGKTLRVKIKCAIQLDDQSLTVKVKDVNFCGFPLPSAWLGGIKDVNLVEACVGSDPAMKTLINGIKHFAVTEDQIELVLAE